MLRCVLFKITGWIALRVLEKVGGGVLQSVVNRNKQNKNTQRQTNTHKKNAPPEGGPAEHEARGGGKTRGTVEGKNIGAPQNSEKHNKIQKTTKVLEKIKRPKNRPESMFFSEI